MHQFSLEMNPVLGLQSQAESRGVIKNLIVMGTIIMLVAYHCISMSHTFCYLSNSSAPTPYGERIYIYIGISPLIMKENH